MAGAEWWRSRAAAANTQIEKARTGIDIAGANVTLTKADRLPRIGAFIYGKMVSPITFEVPVIDKNFMFWGFGVNVSYRLSSLYKAKSKVRSAELKVGEARDGLKLAEERVADDVTAAYNAWLTAVSALRTQRSSVRLAEENYSIVSDRFDEGMALVTDLVDAANVRIAAQTGLENAKSRMLFCLYRLRYLANVE